MSRARPADVVVRTTRPDDINAIIGICQRVYRGAAPWREDQLKSHQSVFPQGQLVAADTATGAVVGMAASLIVRWDDYDMQTNWGDFTTGGYFTNHDPHGATLYAAEVMVDPSVQGRGVGKKLYAARRELARRLGLKRIRAGARLRGYHRYADRLSPEQYVRGVIRGEIGDPTLSFQLKQGFRVIGVVRHYLSHDPESLGHAAVIEWINHRVASRTDYRGRDPKYGRPRRRRTTPDPRHERPGADDDRPASR